MRLLVCSAKDLAKWAVNVSLAKGSSSQDGAGVFLLLAGLEGSLLLIMEVQPNVGGVGDTKGVKDSVV